MDFGRRAIAESREVAIMIPIHEDELLFDIPASMNETGIATRLVFRGAESGVEGFTPDTWLICQQRAEGWQEIELSYDLVWRLRDFVEITLKSHRDVKPLRSRD